MNDNHNHKVDPANYVIFVFNWQGMEYLHAKKIENGKLCSRNVFLESKVKIGMTDYINKHIPIVKYLLDKKFLF